MKLSNFVKKGKNIVEFDVSGIEVKTLNTFRRTVIAGVPSMAIEKVVISANSSILNDELLIHRMGLVPLTTDLKTYTMPAECTCKGEGCGKCTCKLTLDVVGPKTVYSGDMKSLDENVKPVFATIPLVKLLADQKVTMEAEAVLGIGREHIKWQPGMASYEITDKDSFHVLVESFGPLPVEELITVAFEVVEAKIKQVKESM